MALTKVTGELVDIGDLDISNVGSIQLDSIAGDADSNTSITFSGSDVITVATGGSTAATFNADQTTTFSGAISGTSATLTTADNTDTLSLISTDADAAVGPNLRMYRNSGSPADNDYIGEIQFEGRNDNSQDVVYAGMASRLLDASDGTEDGRFELYTILAGAQNSRVLANSTETVINEDSVDLDFRVESNGNANRFFIDGGANSGEGAVIVGHNASLGQHRVFQIAGNSPDTSGMEMFKYTNDTSGPTISMSKSRGGSIGSSTSINDGDNIGTINWFADDGTDTGNYVATIHAEIDGTPGSNDTPGALVFGTTADGANTQTERMRLTSNGYLGIGTTSPEGALDVNIGTAGVWTGVFHNTASGGAGVLIKSTGATGSENLLDVRNGDGTKFVVKQSNGTVIINGTTAEVAGSCTWSIGARNPVQCFNASAYVQNSEFMTFRNQGTQIGSIIMSNTNATTYGTSSDYRLKENVSDMTNATARLKQLKPKRFNWIADTTNTLQDGFLAHEVSPVAPEAIIGDKDAKDSDDNPIYQQIDHSKLVPLLVKTIQELEARIATLEG